MEGLIGKKIGMTSVFNEFGDNVACTVIEMGPCVVTQVKGQDSDGYNAVHTPEKSKFILEKQLSFWKSDEEMMMAAESIKSGGGSSLSQRDDDNINGGDLSTSSIATTTH